MRSGRAWRPRRPRAISSQWNGTDRHPLHAFAGEIIGGDIARADAATLTLDQRMTITRPVKVAISDACTFSDIAVGEQRLCA